MSATETMPTASERRTAAVARLSEARPFLIGAMKSIDGMEGHSTAHEALARAVAAVDDGVDALASYEALEGSDGKYAVLCAEVGCSIHRAELMAEGFHTVSDAHFFAAADPRRAWVVAIEDGKRRWLNGDEDFEVQRAIVERVRAERNGDE